MKEELMCKKNEYVCIKELLTKMRDKRPQLSRILEYEDCEVIEHYLEVILLMTLNKKGRK